MLITLQAAMVMNIKSTLDEDCPDLQMHDWISAVCQVDPPSFIFSSSDIHDDGNNSFLVKSSYDDFPGCVCASKGSCICSE